MHVRCHIRCPAHIDCDLEVRTNSSGSDFCGCDGTLDMDAGDCGCDGTLDVAVTGEVQTCSGNNSKPRYATIAWHTIAAKQMHPNEF